MENYSYSSYPDSQNSSPRSREIDCENASWDEPLSSNYKVRFMCSYGGKIQPRPHDNQLTYVGGDTKILAVDRNIKFSAFMQKLSSLLCDSEGCFKYQLPGEDLDALISVTNDEDLEHMMLEYDRLYRGSAKPARLRLFLFPLNQPVAAAGSFGSGETKSERQWFVDALNSVQIRDHLEVSSPQAAAASEANPDFLFGLDKGDAPPPQPQPQQQREAGKLQDPTPAPSLPEVFPKQRYAGSDCGSEDRHVVGDSVVSPADIHRQMQEFHRLQILSHEQSLLSRNIDEPNPGAYSGDYYTQKMAEKAPPPPQAAVPVTFPTAYWQERRITAGGGDYSVTAAASGSESPVYVIPNPAGMYQASPAIRPVNGGQVGQAYYGMQRVMPEAFWEQPVHSGVSTQSIQQTRDKPYATTELFGLLRPPAQPVTGFAETGYAPVGYDGAGRQVYYTAPPGNVLQHYPAAAIAGDFRQGPEGKIVAKPSPM